MRNLNKKIGVGVLAVGLLVSGGFSQGVINASAASSVSSEESYSNDSHLFGEVSPQRVEDLKSIIGLGGELFKVLEADPSDYYKDSLSKKCNFEEKSLGNDAFIAKLREARRLGKDKDKALKKLDFKSQSYYYLKIPDDSGIKDEIVDGLEILIYVY